MKYRVMLVEDHLIFRNALRLNLEMCSDFDVVAEADTGGAALAALATCRPDVVCLDVNLPDLNGVVLTGKLLAQQPGIKIIGLSAQSNFLVMKKMIDAGAQGYVEKVHAGRDIHTAIVAVCRDQFYLSPDVDVNDAAELAAVALSKRHPICIGNQSDSPNL